jgi:hypothetical protein
MLLCPNGHSQSPGERPSRARQDARSLITTASYHKPMDNAEFLWCKAWSPMQRGLQVFDQAPRLPVRWGHLNHLKYAHYRLSPC